MENWSRFRALWTHRYYKLLHLAEKWAQVARDYVRLRALKSRLGERPLVIIVLSEQMGDVIACEPVARAVRQRHPDAYILWMIRKPYLDLVANHPALDGYLLETCPGQRVQLLGSGLFDHVYNLHLSHRKCKYCNEDPVNPIAERLDVTYANYYHHGDLLYVFSQVAGLPALDETPRMYVPDAVRQRIERRPEWAGAIVLHASASDPNRDWQSDHWNRLAQHLLDTYPFPVLEIGLTPIITLQHPRFHNLCGQLSMLETAEVIRNARLFVGIDSGPAHIANAMQTPGLLLLGALYDFPQYVPYSGFYKHGQGARLLRHPGQPARLLPYQEVEQAVAALLQPVTQP